MNTKETLSKCAPCGASAPQGRLIAYLKLLLGIALIALFMFVVAPLAKHLPAVRQFTQIAEERNLRATAIYYTDLEESAEGSSYIRNSLEYPPRRH